MPATESGFDRLWRRAARMRRVTPALEPILHDVYEEILRQPADAVACVAALETLLTYLCSDEGRTDANCCTVDGFFALPWEGDWSHLPADLRAVVDDMSGVLHDSIYAPRIAATFNSLPEQLLARLRALRTD